MKLEITYSLLGDLIAKQLKKQKVNFNRDKVKLLQEVAFQAMSLHFHELIATNQRDVILSKIHARLEKHCEEMSMELDFGRR
jgi:hypothetical protein